MSLCATCIWILDSELLSPCDDNEYFDDNGDYVREQSITVNSNEELDYLSTYWLFTPDQLGRLKQQATKRRTIVDKLQVLYGNEESDIVGITDGNLYGYVIEEDEPEEDNSEEPSKTPGEDIRDSLTKMGKQTPVHIEKQPEKETEDVRPKAVRLGSFRCHDSDVFRQKLLTHQIHVVSEDRAMEDPTHQKFTQRAGFVICEFSCPQIYTYLGNHLFEGRNVLYPCYAEKWPYRQSNRVSQRNIDRREDQEKPETAGDAIMPKDKAKFPKTKTVIIGGVPREIPVIVPKLLSIEVDGQEIYSDKEYKRGTSNQSSPTNDHKQAPQK